MWCRLRSQFSQKKVLIRVRCYLRTQFSQKKADGEVRWAVLNAVALLRQHEAAHTALAAAMQRGESVGSCIQTLERLLNRDELLNPSADG